MLRISLLMLLACSFAFAIDFMIAGTALRFTQVPSDFPPFTLLPILSACVRGVPTAFLAYAVLKAVSGPPESMFLFVAATALSVSFALPLSAELYEIATVCMRDTKRPGDFGVDAHSMATTAVVTLLADPK